MSLAIRDIGTATSVDHSSVPSGLTARQAQRASFLAAQREFMSASLLANSKEVAPCALDAAFAEATLSEMAFFVPENLLPY